MSFVVQTNRDSITPANSYQPGQFETLTTYNDAIKTRPQLSDLRWAIAPGSVKHMDSILASDLKPSVNISQIPALKTVMSGQLPPDFWNRKVVGVNNQPLDITFGELYNGMVVNPPVPFRPMNWNVHQPGLPMYSSRTATNYVVLQ